MRWMTNPWSSYWNYIGSHVSSRNKTRVWDLLFKILHQLINVSKHFFSLKATRNWIHFILVYPIKMFCIWLIEALWSLLLFFPLWIKFGKGRTSYSPYKLSICWSIPRSWNKLFYGGRQISGTGYIKYFSNFGYPIILCLPEVIGIRE